MVGSGVLAECIEDPRVGSVLVVGRTPCGVAHPKLRELIRSDFFDYRDANAHLKGLDTCFFCLGVSAVGMSESAYHRLTYELTISAAAALADLNPGLTFCYVSGEVPTARSVDASCGRGPRARRETTSCECASMPTCSVRGLFSRSRVSARKRSCIRHSTTSSRRSIPC